MFSLTNNGYPLLFERYCVYFTIEECYEIITADEKTEAMASHFHHRICTVIYVISIVITKI